MQKESGSTAKYTTMVLVVGLLVAVYALADISLASKFSSATPGRGGSVALSSTPTGLSSLAALGNGTSLPGTQDVSNVVVKKITDSLQGVSGLDELVVLPAQSGSGVTVSAMVDLGNHSMPQTQWSPVVKSDVQSYFNGVYQSGETVQNAQIYFTVNQKVVAGAGLGPSAYQKLSAETATGGPGFIQELASAPMVTNQSTSDTWFQMQTVANAP